MVHQGKKETRFPELVSTCSCSCLNLAKPGIGPGERETREILQVRVNKRRLMESIIILIVSSSRPRGLHICFWWIQMLHTKKSQKYWRGEQNQTCFSTNPYPGNDSLLETYGLPSILRSGSSQLLLPHRKNKHLKKNLWCKKKGKVVAKSSRDGFVSSDRRKFYICGMWDAVICFGGTSGFKVSITRSMARHDRTVHDLQHACVDIKPCHACSGCLLLHNPKQKQLRLSQGDIRKQFM